MGDTVYAGLAVTSHQPRHDAALIDSLELLEPPFECAAGVSVTSPAAGARFTLPATVTLNANATDTEARMASVDFYAGSTLSRGTPPPPLSRRPGRRPLRGPMS